MTNEEKLSILAEHRRHVAEATKFDKLSDLPPIEDALVKHQREAAAAEQARRDESERRQAAEQAKSLAQISGQVLTPAEVDRRIAAAVEREHEFLIEIVAKALGDLLASVDDRLGTLDATVAALGKTLDALVKLDRIERAAVVEPSSSLRRVN